MTRKENDLFLLPMNGSYLKRLPHLRRKGGCFFVTLCTFDSFPIQTELKVNDPNFLHHFKICDQDHNMHIEGINLASPALAKILTKALVEYDGKRYNILYSCILQSHIHLVLDTGILFDPFALPALIRKFKNQSTQAMNLYLKRTGPIWQKLQYVWLIKEDEDLGKTGQYILEDPVRAGAVQRWEDWPYTYVKYM